MNYRYGSAASSLGAFFTAYGLLTIGLAVFMVIVLWRIFQKAGQPGWKTLIPVYNAIVFYNIAWKFIYFLIPIGIMVLGIILTVIAASSGSYDATAALGAITVFLFAGAGIAMAVLEIIAMVNLAKRFGKSGGFAVGLIFLAPIFLAILAFDQSRYYLNTGWPSGEMAADTYTNPYGKGYDSSSNSDDDQW